VNPPYFEKVGVQWYISYLYTSGKPMARGDILIQFPVRES
jgi:hypothetical protein